MQHQKALLLAAGGHSMCPQIVGLSGESRCDCEDDGKKGLQTHDAA